MDINKIKEVVNSDLPLEHKKELVLLIISSKLNKKNTMAHGTPRINICYDCNQN